MGSNPRTRNDFFECCSGSDQRADVRVPGSLHLLGPAVGDRKCRDGVVVVVIKMGPYKGLLVLTNILK